MLLSQFKLRASALGVVGLMGLAACGNGGGGTSTALASDQTLKFPVFGDFGTLDPAELSAEVDSEIAQNVFNGPFKFDNDLNIQPDLATEVPTTSNGGISADGLTYTIKLRKDVTFSNGDKFTSADLLYSWNRAAALQGPYASNLSAVDGFSAVAKAVKNLKPTKAQAKADPNTTQVFNKAVEALLEAKDPKTTMAGLTAPDDYTVKVHLSATAGWFVSAVALEGTTGMVVDKNAISKNPRDWWQTPTSLVGTGAFKMTGYTSKQSVDFAAVDNWWGSPKPVLKKIHIDQRDPGAASQSSAIQQWEQGKYDIVGYGGWSNLPKEDILRIQKDSNEVKKLTLQPKVRTTYVTFNVNSKHPAKGPFTDTNPKAKELREAFALAVDKTALAKTVCSNVTCAAATGGVITKGLTGYLGDGADPLGKFDATKAKADLKDADPTGALTKSLKYSYNTGAPNDDVATFLQSQWKQNLGLDVSLDPQQDTTTFINDRFAGKFVMSRDGWQADYNHPQDWFDNLWGQQQEDAGSNSSGYAPNATDQYNTLLTKADGLPLDQALPSYKQISQLLISDVVYIPLYYSVGQFLIQPWAKGAGTNNFFDHYWNEISIQQHS
ncbi:MAG TPA: peptide ABC transporter substrate-binding protein [Candidatus Dormibacteraeota bacterium]